MSNSERDVPVEEGPGHRLRAAREAKKLGLGQVAAELHLGEDVVTALEHDEYGQLSGPVFVQGYLRKYARLLGESEELVIQAYHQLAPEGHCYSAAAGAPLNDVVHGSHPVVRTLLWLLVIGLLGLALAWWRGGIELPQMESVDDSAVSSSHPVDVPVIEQMAAPVISEPVISNSLVQEGGYTGPAEAAQEEALVEPVVEPVVDNVPVEPVVAAALDAASQYMSEDVVSEAAVAIEEAPVVAPGPPQSEEVVADQESTTEGIVFEFMATCWVDIRDANGKSKLLGNIPMGTRRVLEGDPPFAVILGNSQAVKITINGQPFDVTPYSRGNVARFKLDTERLAEATL